MNVVIIAVSLLIIVVIQTVLMMQINHWAYWRGYQRGFRSGELATEERLKTD